MQAKRILSSLIVLVVFAASAGFASLDEINLGASETGTNIGQQSLLPTCDSDGLGVRSCIEGSFQNTPSQCNTSFSGDVTVVDCCGQLQDIPREDKISSQVFPLHRGFLKSIFRRAP